MSWHYQAKRIKDDFSNNYEYTLVEVCPKLQIESDDIVPHYITTKFYGETPEELAKLLRQAADDVEKYDVMIEGE
jgi:hypothetical protein